MNAHRLILIEGTLGSGKTSLTRALARAARQSGLPARWIVEHTRPHPTHAYRALREWQQPWKQISINGLIEHSLAGWRQFVEHIIASGATGQIVFSAGALMRGDLEALFRMDCPPDTLLDYTGYLLETLRPLQPAIIYLYEEDFPAALAREAQRRGPNWVNFQVTWAGLTPYVQNHDLKGLEAWTGLTTDLNTFSQAAFKTSNLPRLEREVSQQDWAALHTEALRWLDIPPASLPAARRSLNSLYDRIYDLIL